MRSNERDPLDVLYPSDVIDRWKRWNRKPFHIRFIEAVKNFFLTLLGEIEGDE